MANLLNSFAVSPLRGLALAIMLALAACGGGNGGGSGTGSPEAVSSTNAALALAKDQPKGLRVEPMTRGADGPKGESTLSVQPKRAMPLAYSVKLEPASGSLAKAVQIKALAQYAGPPGVRTPIGVGLELPGTATAAATGALWRWQPQATGQAIGRKSAAISFTTSGAAAVRLGLEIHRLPADAVLRFYAQSAATVIEVSGSEVMATLRRNVAADGDKPAAWTYWTPVVEGAEATVEIDLPQGTTGADLDLAVPRLSHQTVPTESLTRDSIAKIGQSASCEIDVNCTTGFSVESNATAKMSFVAADGFSYVCTGTLLNDRLGTGTPYFLSANHCISLQSEASTLNTYWFYRSSACNSGRLNANSKTLVGGATLLYASASTDTSLMQLKDAPPAGATYAGWDTTSPSVGAALVGVHQPSGDLQKLSTGAMKSYTSCTTLSNSESFNCSAATATTGNFLSVQWNRGVTEAGSSGSGLYKTIGTTNYLVGQLYGGSSSCTAPTAADAYGRFDTAFNAALSKWLNGANPATGYWWNPAESGRGYGIELQGDQISLVAYMFEASGASTWYSALLDRQLDGSFSGNLSRNAGGQTFTGAYKAPTASALIATVKLTLTSTTKGSLTVFPADGSAAKTLSLERFSFSTPAFAASAGSFENGIWWNESQSGRGFMIEAQGSQAIVGSYLYDDTGQSTWYTMVSAVQGGKSISGSLQQYVNGQTLLGGYVPSSAKPGSAGTLSFSALTSTTGNLTLPSGETIPLKRFVFGSTAPN